MADLPQHVIDFEHVSVEGRGVNLGDAYDGNVAALGNNRDAPAFDVVNMGVTAKITLRIQVCYRVGFLPTPVPSLRQAPSMFAPGHRCRTVLLSPSIRYPFKQNRGLHHAWQACDDHRAGDEQIYGMSTPGFRIVTSCPHLFFRPPQESAGPIQYKGQTLELGNLVLTKLYHVSRGSWQPEFKVNIA